MNRFLIILLTLFAIFGCRYEEKSPYHETVVCITFDDNCKTVYTEALPIMHQYGFRGTTFVNTGRIGYPAFCSWEQLADLKQTYHWEIGGHTLTHQYLSRLTPEEAEHEIGADYNNLIQHNMNPVSFATPFGECPVDYYKIIRKYYKNIRTTLNTTMNNPIDRSFISSYWVGKSASPEDLKNRVLNGISDQEALITFYFHDIADADQSSYESSCYSPENFREFIAKLHQMNVKVLPLNEALDYLEDN